MTTAADVIVVGGGLLGCATALTLARDGCDVVLLERDQVNQHASGQNAGSLHFQLEYRMVERGLAAARVAAEAMPLHLDAAQRWADLGRELGTALGVAQTGGLMVAETAEQARVLESKCELERAGGLEVDLLSARELRELAPYLSASVVAAEFCPIEGKADARTAAPALARAAVEAGARIRTRTEVVGLARTSGRWRVTTRTARPDGSAVERHLDAQAVILAAGAWTERLCRMVGLRLPIIPLALMMTVTARVPTFLPHLVQHAGGRLSLKQTTDGTVLVGGGWPATFRDAPDGSPDIDARPDILSRSVVGNARAAVRVVPRVRDLPALRTWGGITTVAADQLPIVGPATGLPGLFLATGGSAFTLGPSFARVLADAVQGRRPTVDLDPFSPARFGVTVHVPG